MAGICSDLLRTSENRIFSELRATDVPLLGILCASFNSAEVLSGNLCTLGPGRSKVFVADKGRGTAGHDAFVETCRRGGFNVLQVRRSVGFVETVNQLAKRAIGDGCTHLLIQNTTVRMGPAELETLLRFSENHPDTILSPTIWSSQDEVWFEGGSFDIKAGVVQRQTWNSESVWLPAAFLLVPAEVWQSLGGFSQGLFSDWRDADLTFRWHNSGGQLAVLQVPAVQAVDALQKRRSRRENALHIRRIARSRLIFAGKNLGTRDLLRWMRSQGKYVDGLRLQFDRESQREANRYSWAAMIGSFEGGVLGSIWQLRNALRRSKQLRSGPVKQELVVSVERHWSAELVQQVNPRPRLFAFPYYSDNPWQTMLYESLSERGTFEIVPMVEGSLLPDHSRLLPGDVLHVNWTAPISQSAEGRGAAQARVAHALAAIEDAREHGVRVVWTVHNAMPHECPYPEAELALVRGLAKVADAVMIMNPDTVKLVEANFHLPSEKVWALPHSSYLGNVPEAIERRSAKSRLGLPDESVVILCFGQIRPYKQIGHVVTAFRRLNNSNFRLVIAGAPSGGETAERIVELCADDSRIILLLQRQEDVATADLFSAADLLVQSYRAGLNSGVAALSATYGCPVVVAVSPDTGALRNQPWVSGVNLSDEQTSGLELGAAIEWAIAGGDGLRRAARSWAHADSPVRISLEFAKGIERVSRTGRIQG